MLQKATASRLFIVFVVLSYSTFSPAHPDHDATDMILSNYGDLGKVEFSISCESDDQQTINSGLALLHHMMYAQAELVFSNQLKDSPDCAMLYWGYSMSLFHPLWPDTISPESLTLGLELINKAKQLKTTEREKDYINAAAAFYDNWQGQTKKSRITNWANAQKVVLDNNPNDIDADALYSLSLLSTASPSDSSFSQQKVAGARLNKIFMASPTHPGAIHYSIHAFDNPVLAEQAISVARAYDKIAPDVPHALHMPSHVFVRLGMWEDVISWNIRSAKAALKYPTKDATSMHYVHAIDYLIYGYLQVDDSENALRALQQMNTHHPVQQNFASAYAFAAIPARLALEKHDWESASQLELNYPSYFDWSKFPQLQAMTFYARGLGSARINDLESASTNLKTLKELYIQTNKISPNYWAVLVDSQIKTVSAWIQYSQGNTESAIAEMTLAADMEDSVDKNPVTPSHVLPAREQLGDMLMLIGKNTEATKAYEVSLKTNPNRLISLSGLKNSLATM